MNMEYESGPELCGPHELLGKLLDGRDAGRRTTPERYGSINPEAVVQLVLLCYYASQAGEEGRFPAFRVFVPPSNNLPPGLHDPWQLLRFSQPLALNSVDDLKRLAPAASSHSYALEVREDNNEDGRKNLLCIGIRMAHSGEGGTKVLSSSIWGRLVRPGLMIRVDAAALQKTGTRHLSAFHLCNAAEETTAYVISQDGHVTLFWSDAKVVWRWSEYLPWIKPSDHF
jgi:hypothetical protein